MRNSSVRITMIAVVAAAVALLTAVCVRYSAGGTADGSASEPSSQRSNDLANAREEDSARRETESLRGEFEKQLTDIAFPGPVDVYLAGREFDAKHPSLTNVVVLPGLKRAAGVAFLRVRPKGEPEIQLRLDDILAVKLLKPDPNEKTSVTMLFMPRWADEKVWTKILAARHSRQNPESCWPIGERLNIYLAGGVFDTNRPSFADADVYRGIDLAGCYFLFVIADDDKSLFRLNFDRILAFKVPGKPTSMPSVTR